MRRPLSLALFVTALLAAGWSIAAARSPWPSVDSQLAEAKAASGSALERFIRSHQDVSMLRPDEASDARRIPLFLRVAWRKAHPENTYSAADPSGGYPLALREVAEWMRAHPDLERAPREADVAEPPLRATVSANVRISGVASRPRSESDIRIDFRNPSRVIAGSNNLDGSGRQLQSFSTTGGATWGQTTLPLVAGDQFHSDPAVDWTSDGTAWSVAIGIIGSGQALRLRAYRSTDGGASWAFDGTVSGNHTGADKELLWIDHASTSPFRNNQYVIWHNGQPAFVARRTAAGWQAPVRVSRSESTGTAIGGDIKTNSAGHVFAYWPTTGNRKVFVARSTNGGMTFGAPVQVATTFDSFDIGIPAMAGRRALIYVSGGAYRTANTNNVYAAWTDLSGEAGCRSASDEPGTNGASACKTRIWFSRSTNGGATWSAPRRINPRTAKTDQFNQALAVDETNGRIGIVYYDTFGDATRRSTHLWYQSSSDHGATWKAPLRVTTARTNESVAGADFGNQYGDYNSLTGFLGKFLPSWTDRRGGGNEEVWTARISDP